MQTDGGQVFTYAQQERDTEFVCLYTADFINQTPTNKYYLIKVQDEPDVRLPKGKRSYKEATNVSELYNVWKNTYELDYQTKGLLEDNVDPYKIGQNSRTVDDLVNVDSATVQTKYNEYATILRKYNVSGRENAFDKLVNIFLVKLIDEIQNTDLKEQGLPQNLQCYWRGISYDDTYKLQDRLQKLYKDGMEKFLGEDVIYIDNSQIDEAFRLFKNDPDATKDTIKNYFRQLKFYSNNDFSFINVHNEELFNQNSLILLDVIRMIQDLKLKSDNEQTFLGDLFEGFLNQGIKQSEGQFFTPLPIVRFIISSLPLQDMIKTRTEPLKVIDYACGAGHFLNEYGRQITKFVPQPEEYYKQIVGIEKEYRLSKVSKVSAFMYGFDGINIIYGDGLTDNKGKIKDGIYDLVIANPPYSVDGFLGTLSEDDRNKFEIFNNGINLITCDAIQLFFIERTKQILKDGGIAAIIIPDTVLTKNENLYSETQKLILRNFDIVAICAMSKGTFWKTGTQTHILFLRKKSSNPPLSKHYKYRVEEWFKNNFSVDNVFEDAGLLADYAKVQEKSLQEYLASVYNGTDEYKRNEQEKLYYYLLARSNPSKVLIVQTPTESKDIQNFLGYSWSNRRGQEGLHYNNEKTNNENGINAKGINQIETPLFDPNNLFDNKEKINSLIRNNFNDEQNDVPVELCDYVKKLNLVDMFNFKADKFVSSFNLNANMQIEIKSKFECKKLGDLITENEKSSIQVNECAENTSGAYPFFTSGTNIYRADEPLVNGENVYMATGGMATANYYNGEAAYSTDTYSFTTDNTVIKTKYLFEILQTIMLQINILCFKGTGLKHLQKPVFKEIKIPVPDLDIQQKIVDECAAIDEKIVKLTSQQEEWRQKIEEIIADSLNNHKLVDYRLDDEAYFDLFIGQRVEQRNTDKSAQYPVYSANVTTLFGEGYTNMNPHKDIKAIKNNGFTKDSILWGIDGNWMTSYVARNVEFYPTDHCGVLRISDNSTMNPYFVRFAFDRLGKKEHFDRTKRAKIEAVKALTIQLPDIEIQNQAIDEVKKMEEEIAKAKQEISREEQSKTTILEKYLN
jgi:type I restriction-modification system DNA methylase subunit/restriction endonuclease S subunit